MKPVLFRLGTRDIHSYPAMQYVGLTLGVLCGNAAAHVVGLDAYKVFIATVILLFPALAGARLLHVVSNWKYYRDNRSHIWNTREGGAAQYGGILLALPLSIPLLEALGVPFGGFWDVASITIMVGMVFTRVGCFLNGCCAGRPSGSWLAMNLPDVTGHWEPRFPTQLFEALWALILLSAGWALWPVLPFAGALFVFVASGYACGRLVMESLRELHGRSGFTIHHAISILIIVVSIGALVARSSQ